MELYRSPISSKTWYAIIPPVIHFALVKQSLWCFYFQMEDSEFVTSDPAYREGYDHVHIHIAGWRKDVRVITIIIWTFLYCNLRGERSKIITAIKSLSCQFSWEKAVILFCPSRQSWLHEFLKVVKENFIVMRNGVMSTLLVDHLTFSLCIVDHTSIRSLRRNAA